MSWFENGGEPPPDNWFTRLGDYAQNTFQNPLVQAGIGLATGGPQGMHQGIQNAQNFANQRQQQQMMPLKMELLRGQVQAAGREAEMHPLNMAYKQAQADKLRRDTLTGGEQPSNIREWHAFQRMSDAEKEQYLNMKRAQPWLNTDTGFTRPNPVNPAAPPVAVIPRNVGDAASEREVGKLRGAAIVNLDAVRTNADLLRKQIKGIREHPRLSAATGVGGYLPTYRSDTVDVEERIKQLQGGVFLQAYEALKGAGQITEIEGEKAEKAKARIQNLKQSDAGYLQALQDFEDEVANLVRLAERKAQAGAPPAAGGGQAADPLGIR